VEIAAAAAAPGVVKLVVVLVNFPVFMKRA